MGSLSHHLPLGIEYSAGKIASFLDVGRERGSRQNYTHLFSYGTEQFIEHFYFNDIEHNKAAAGVWN
jgi:hypothetical protein